MFEFFNKFIGHMYGPYFLIFYAAYIAILYFACKYSFYIIDKSNDREVPHIPKEPDPYIVAYIRNGPKEVIKCVLFSLIERKYLIVNTAKTTLKVAKKHPPIENLINLEAVVFDFMVVKSEIGEMIESAALQIQVENLCKQNELLKKHDDLVIGKNLRVFENIKGIAGFLVLALGAYKFIMAVLSGHSNVFFLMILGVVGLIIIFNIKPNSFSSKRGKLFIKDLETVYYSKYEQGANFVSPYNQLLLASIFGFQFLYGKGYKYLEIYRSPTYNNYGGGSGSSCSSSCGSSCGGGCGGGCGGCS